MPLDPMSGPILTVRQPWAWAIIHAGKDVENRTWPTNYRGKLLIHAGKKLPTIRDMEAFADTVSERQLLHCPNIEGPLTLRRLVDELCIYGAIIGSVNIWGCKRQSKSAWGVGPIHWLLSDPEPMEPEYMPGRLGLWRRK